MPSRPKTPKKKRAAAKKKTRAAAKPAARARATVKRRSAAAPRVAARAKPAAKPKSRAKPRPSAKPKPKLKPKPKPKPKKPPASAPSERALAASAQKPRERSLSDDERDAMTNVAATARRHLDAVGGPDAVVHRIAAFLDEVRAGVRPEPRNQDVRLGLGALWGEQLRVQVGWVWVHLTYPDGFASYAVVPDDRAFACFPLNRVQELMQPGTRTNTSVALFNAIVAGTLPARRANAYLVIG